MKYFESIQIVFIVIILSAFFPGCLQEPEKSSTIVTPVVSVNTSVTPPLETPLVRTPSNYIVLIDDYSFYKVTETTIK